MNNCLFIILKYGYLIHSNLVNCLFSIMNLAFKPLTSDLVSFLKYIYIYIRELCMRNMDFSLF